MMYCTATTVISCRLALSIKFDSLEKNPKSCPRLASKEKFAFEGIKGCTVCRFTLSRIVFRTVQNLETVLTLYDYILLIRHTFWLVDLIVSFKSVQTIEISFSRYLCWNSLVKLPSKKIEKSE